jgi:hypothetical protein
MRKTMLVVLALVALAAMPAAAQARVNLTTSKGESLIPGATIKLFSPRIELFKNNSILYECTNSETLGTIGKNPQAVLALENFLYTPCIGLGMQQELLLSMPANLSFEDEGGVGEAHVPNAQFTLRYTQGTVCKYSSNLNFGVKEFGAPLSLYVKNTTLTKISGGSLCEPILTMYGSFAVTYGFEEAVYASSEPVGLFKKSGGTSSPVSVGEELQTSSTTPTIKLGGSSVTCTKDTLKGTATHPGAQPAQATITSSSFTGNAGSNNCVWEGITTEVTTNASKGWNLSFEDTAGKEAKGSLTGPLRVTVSMLVFGYPMRACTYEASSMGTTYSFKQALGLKFNTTSVKLVESSGPEKEKCPSSGEINLGESTVTSVPSGLSIEVLAL